MTNQNKLFASFVIGVSLVALSGHAVAHRSNEHTKARLPYFDEKSGAVVKAQNSYRDYLPSLSKSTPNFGHYASQLGSYITPKMPEHYGAWHRFTLNVLHPKNALHSTAHDRSPGHTLSVLSSFHPTLIRRQTNFVWREPEPHLAQAVSFLHIGKGGKVDVDISVELVKGGHKQHGEELHHAVVSKLNSMYEMKLIQSGEPLQSDGQDKPQRYADYRYTAQLKK